jgi:hypothetical protein
MRVSSPPLSALGLLALALSAAGPSARAEVISFEEIAAQNSNASPVSEEYAALGVHFVTTDDGSVWSGTSAGDPGGWQLEGTNGTSFLGFNGKSYGLTVDFDAPVSGFQVDVAASMGSQPGQTFTLEGYLGGALVETVTVTLGGVNEWVTAGLTQDCDEVVWSGGGSSAFRPFGADNVRWSGDGSPPVEPPPDEEPPAGPPPVVQATIDVSPGHHHDVVNPLSQGHIVVALLGSADLAAQDVLIDSLALGPGGAAADPDSARLEDVNGDGVDDLVAEFPVAATGLAFGDTQVCLMGSTDAVDFVGCGDVLTLGSAPGGHGKSCGGGHGGHASVPHRGHHHGHRSHGHHHGH